VTPGAPSNARERAARAWMPSPTPHPVEPDSDASTAVVAHGLLSNLAVVRGVTRMLLGDPALGQSEREKLLSILDVQVDLMQGVLTDLVRGLPSQALAALDELRLRQ
jgi:hypothetical protein